MDYFLENIRLYSKYLALVAAVIGTLNFRYYKTTKAKFFLFSVWYIIITEFVGENLSRWFDVIYNNIVYNIYIVIQFTFYLWWYQSLLKSENRKKIVKAFCLIFLVFGIVNIIFFQDVISEATSYSYALAVIFLVTSICYYFIEVFNSEKVLSIRSSGYFWFSLGLILFHATFMPFYFAFDYFLIGNLKLLSVVNFLLCVIMYTFFLIGFIKLRNNNNEHKLV